jgi:hypothetical protein
MDSSMLYCYTNQHYQFQLSTYFQPYIWLPEMSKHYIFTLKMTTAMFAKMLEDFQYLVWLIPEAKVVQCKQVEMFILQLNT